MILALFIINRLRTWRNKRFLIGGEPANYSCLFESLNLSLGLQCLGGMELSKWDLMWEQLWQAELPVTIHIYLVGVA